ncbi:MAG: hypothetical protein NT007_13920 [Candidatus Kapabacteria bacterium]|nr:hypothetical protein [Candidatus Kapabacteria bacterium]
MLKCTIQILTGIEYNYWFINDQEELVNITNLLDHCMIKEWAPFDTLKPGYRSIRLQSKENIWEIYNGSINLTHKIYKQYSLIDDNRNLEKLLLNTAPKEMFNIINMINDFEF